MADSFGAASRARRSRRCPRGWTTASACIEPEQGGFAVDASSQRADIDATATAVSFLRQVGAIPGTWERERLRGAALLAGPRRAAPVDLRPGEDAVSLPLMSAVNSSPGVPRPCAAGREFWG